MTEHFHRAKLGYNQIAGQSVERLAGLSDGVFAVAMTLLGLTLYWSWVSALGSNLVRNYIPVHISRAIKRRMVIGQSVYALGALLCFFNPYWRLRCSFLCN